MVRPGDGIGEVSKRTGRFIVMVVVLFRIAAVAQAFQWPVPERVLTATFGESRWDHFHTGIDVGGGAQPVFPIDPGEVIYYHDDTHRERAPVSGLGAFVVLEHDRGIRSLYAHLEPDSLSESSRSVEPTDRIGTIGDSGASYGKHLHLEVIDSELGSYVNPLVVLPALSDTTRPAVRRVFVVMEDGGRDQSPVARDRRDRVPSGEHRLLVDLHDVSEHVAYYCPVAPYEITGYFNGSQVFDFEFDSLRERSGNLVVGRGEDRRSFRELYYDDWIIDVGVVPFRVGEIQIEIVAGDIAGNETVFRLPITVE